jgi:hypothetical protein
MKALLFFAALVFVACAATACQGADAAVAAATACHEAAQAAAMGAGDQATATLTAAYVPGSCECAFLPQVGADVTCCTDETWAPAAAEPPGACVCTFTAHMAIPADTFRFFACADVV